MRANFRFFVFALAIISLLPFVFAFNGQNFNGQKEVYFFWGRGCSHCENVFKSGVLDEVKSIENVSLFSYEVRSNQTGREKYLFFVEKFKISEDKRGIPFAVVVCGNLSFYLSGDKPIIKNLKDSVLNCLEVDGFYGGVSYDDPNTGKITLLSIIVAALIDSINPCAFGVLIFLLATLLSVSSSIRALRYGLVYVFVIFVVYFFAGLGIYKFIFSFSHIVSYVLVISGAIVFIGGIIEIKDFFWYGKGISLKIPSKFKPLMEGVARKGTLGAVIFLGFLVALVELPCTGGIYLAILSLMHVNKSFGISYLFLYNLIFVLPLLFIVFFAYFTMRTDKVSVFLEKNKRYMRLAGGVLMIILGFYLINSVYNFI